MTEPNPYGNEETPGPGGPGGEYTWGPPPGYAPGSSGYAYPNPASGYGYPNPGPGYGYPDPAGPGGTLPAVPGPSPLAGGSPLLSIGDITVLNTGSIVTPSGTLPLRGAVWNATDMSRTEEKIPTHAVVLAIVFFIFCLLGLLFLLMKERTTTGFIQVGVTSNGKHHSTMLPATNPQSFQMVMAQISYARSISV
jgi:hypothetical protein